MNNADRVMNELDKAKSILFNIRDIVGEDYLVSYSIGTIYVYANYDIARQIQKRLNVSIMRKNSFDLEIAKGMGMVIGDVKMHVYITDLPPNCRVEERQVTIPARPERTTTEKVVVCEGESR